MTTTVSVTVRPQWLVTCDQCSWVRRYEDETCAAVAARIHQRDCPGRAPVHDLKPKRGGRR